MAKVAGVEQVFQAETREDLEKNLTKNGVLIVRVTPGNADVPS